MAYFDEQFDAHLDLAAATRDAVREQYDAMLAAWLDALGSGSKILLFGNGGSAADAQHLAAELVGQFTVDRKGLAGIALTTDTSALTAIGNDRGFDQVFTRQLESLGRPGDVAVGFTSSGNSANITNALTYARANGIVPAAFCAGDGGELAGLADPMILVPGGATPRIQEMHITLGHMLCGQLEIELGLV
ncbi:MAG: SIS domain-containing protein [Thermoleophilaceae bacterium]|nr:SIS domain-containing protein [Thermoleophilaceae bacterium]